MSKVVPPPTYVAPTEGEDDLQEFTDEFYDQEFVVAKGEVFLIVVMLILRV